MLHLLTTILLGACAILAIAGGLYLMLTYALVKVLLVGLVLLAAAWLVGSLVRGFWEEYR